MAEEIMGEAAVKAKKAEKSDLLEVSDTHRAQIIESSQLIDEGMMDKVKSIGKKIKARANETRAETDARLRTYGVVPRGDTPPGGSADIAKKGKKKKGAFVQKNLPGMDGVKTEGKTLTVPGDVNVMRHVKKPKHFKPKMHGIHKLSVPSEQNADVTKVSHAAPGNNTISHHAVSDSAGNSVSKAASVKLTSNQLMKLKEAHDIMRSVGLLEGKSNWNDFGGQAGAVKVTVPGDKQISAGIKKASKLQTLKPTLADSRKTQNSEDDETQGRIHNDMDRMHNMGKGGKGESPIGQQGPKPNIVTFKDHKERQSFDEFIGMVTEKQYAGTELAKAPKTPSNPRQLGPQRVKRNKAAANLKVIRKHGIKAGRAFAKRPGGLPIENTPSVTQALDSNARRSNT